MSLVLQELIVRLCEMHFLLVISEISLSKLNINPRKSCKNFNFFRVFHYVWINWVKVKKKTFFHWSRPLLIFLTNDNILPQVGLATRIQKCACGDRFNRCTSVDRAWMSEVVCTWLQQDWSQLALLCNLFGIVQTPI